MLSLSTILAFLAPVAFKPAPQVKEPDAIGRALLKTADIIREKGWCRTGSYGPNGEVCIGVAIGEALGGRGYMGAWQSGDVWERFAASHRSARNHHRSPCYWNDSVSKDSKESLIRALKKAAYA